MHVSQFAPIFQGISYNPISQGHIIRNKIKSLLQPQQQNTQFSSYNKH